MSLLFMDGFDHLSLTEYLALAKWENAPAAGTIGTVSPGRWSTGSYLHFNSGGGIAAGMRKNVAAANATSILGFAMRLVVVPNGHAICGIYDSPSQQVDIRINSNLQVFATRNGTTLGSASTASLILNKWYWIDVKFVVDPSAGSVEFRADGIVLLNLSSQNTRATANTSYNQVFIGTSSVSAVGMQTDFDDFFALDAAGSVNNAILGERRVYTLFPTGAGATTSWTKVGASATNWQSVNESPPNGDTTYVTSATIGQVDTYAFGDLPSTASAVNGVQMNLYARKDDAGTRTIAPVQRNGAGTQVDGTTSANLNAAYIDQLSVYETSIVSATTWGVAEINGSEFGVKMVA